MADQVVLARFVDGSDDPAGVELVREALRRWLASDGELHLQRYLGLRAPAEYRRGQRDRWLRRAAGHFGDVVELAAAIRRFEAGPWRRWCGADVPPGDAGELEQALFFALKAAELPESDRQLRRIVAADMKSGGNVRAIAA